MVSDLKYKTVESRVSVFTRPDKRMFWKKFPEYRNISERKMNQVIAAFHEEIINEMQNNRYGVLLPESLGILFIANAGKAKEKVMNPIHDIIPTSVARYHNFQTDNNLMRITYINKPYKNVIRNSELYSFKACTLARKSCSKFFIKNWQRCLISKYRYSPDQS